MILRSKGCHYEVIITFLQGLIKRPLKNNCLLVLWSLITYAIKGLISPEMTDSAKYEYLNHISQYYGKFICVLFHDTHSGVISLITPECVSWNTKRDRTDIDFCLETTKLIFGKR